MKTNFHDTIPLNIPIETFVDIHKFNHFLIVDVRSNEERQAGYIEGSVHVPLNKLLASVTMLETQINNNCNIQHVVFYCAMGGRSRMALDFAAENSNLYDISYHHLQGGITAWIAQKNPIIQDS